MSAIWAKVHFIRGNVHKHGILSTLLIGQSPINKVDKDPHPPPIKERKAPPINGSESLNIKTLIKKTFTLFIKFEGAFFETAFFWKLFVRYFFPRTKINESEIFCTYLCMQFYLEILYIVYFFYDTSKNG